MTDKKTEALKLAQAFVRWTQFGECRTEHHEGPIPTAAQVDAAIREALAEQPAQQQEPVACAVCNEVHTILDTDESKIIRNAADGYPEGRAPRVLTLQERVIALCVYAADWKRWCIEKENALSASKPWVGLTDWEREKLRSEADDADAGYSQIIKATEAKLREKNT